MFAYDRMENNARISAVIATRLFTTIYFISPYNLLASTSLTI